MPSRQLQRGQLLIGDAERSACLDQLTEHHAAGRLSAEEIDVRIDAALAARTTAELDELLADLPRTCQRKERPAFGRWRNARPLLGVGGVAILAQLVMDNAGAGDGPYVLFGAAVTGVAGLVLGRQSGGTGDR